VQVACRQLFDEVFFLGGVSTTFPVRRKRQRARGLPPRHRPGGAAANRRTTGVPEDWQQSLDHSFHRRIVPRRVNSVAVFLGAFGAKRAIRYRWGASATAVRHWRRALGVERCNEHSKRLLNAAAAETGRKTRGRKAASGELRTPLADASSPIGVYFPRRPGGGA
jgi:hypothetical protein